MSLEFVIDGYNLIKHSQFKVFLKGNMDARCFLLNFIREKKLCGSFKNKIVVVFDGGFDSYLDSLAKAKNIRIVFSSEISADDWIKNYVAKAKEVDRKNILVITDDRELRSKVLMEGAKVLNIEEFLRTKIHTVKKLKKEEIKPELSYSQIQKINEELRRIWNL